MSALSNAAFREFRGRVVRLSSEGNIEPAMSWLFLLVGAICVSQKRLGSQRPQASYITPTYYTIII